MLDAVAAFFLSPKFTLVHAIMFLVLTSPAFVKWYQDRQEGLNRLERWSWFLGWLLAILAVETIIRLAQRFLLGLDV